MAKLGFEWKSDEVEDEKPFGEKVLFPAGDYIGVAIDSDVKDTKNGTGRFVYVKWQDGERRQLLPSRRHGPRAFTRRTTAAERRAFGS